MALSLRSISCLHQGQNRWLLLMVASLRAVIVFPTLSSPCTCVRQGGWWRLCNITQVSLFPTPGWGNSHPLVLNLYPFLKLTAASIPKGSLILSKEDIRAWILRVPQLPFQSCLSSSTWACHLPSCPLGEFYALPEVSGMDSFPPALPINSQPNSHLSHDKSKNPFIPIPL